MNERISRMANIALAASIAVIVLAVWAVFKLLGK